MTTAAIGTEAAAMHVVADVTAATILGQPDRTVHRLHVAARAGEPLVTTSQGKIGLRVVVELPALPAVRVVALPASGAERPAVGVVGSMTRDALTIRTAKDVPGVTIAARRHGMQTEQRKARQLVIEAQVGGPRALVVTPAAVLALTSIVHIVLGVARDACRAKLLFVGRPGVATRAINLLV